MREKGYAVSPSPIGLGFQSTSPVRIAIKRASSYHRPLMKKFHMTRNSVFDRLGPPKMTRQFFKLKGDHVASKNGWLASSCKKKILTNVFMHYGDIKVRAETIEETMSKEEDEESVASCNHITISNDEPLEEEDAGVERKKERLA